MARRAIAPIGKEERPAVVDPLERVSIENVRRAELVEAAIRVIAQRGFDQATVRDIAQAAGASNGSVHYYFKSKDDLLQAAFEEGEVRFRRRVADACQRWPTALDQLDALVRLSFEEGADDDYSWDIEIDIWQQASRHAQFRPMVESAHAWWVETIAGVLKLGAERGEIGPLRDVRQTATAIAALIDGLGIYCRVTDQVTDPIAREIVRTHLRTLLATAGDARGVLAAP